MKLVPFIELHVADSELEGEQAVAGTVMENAEFIVNHCVRMVPHMDGNQLTTSLIYPAGITGINVKESYEEIETKIKDVLGMGLLSLQEAEEALGNDDQDG